MKGNSLLILAQAVPAGWGQVTLTRSSVGGRTLYPLSTMRGSTVSGSAERIIGMDQMAGQTDYGSQRGNPGKARITVVAETVVRDRGRREGEFLKQPNQWARDSQDA
jgi:hypothetical protein